MPEASLPPACAMAGFPPPPPLICGAMALMSAFASKPAATASGVPAASTMGLPSFSAASTTAPGRPRRARRTSHAWRMPPASMAASPADGRLAMMTG